MGQSRSRRWWILQLSAAAFVCALLAFCASLPIEKWRITLDAHYFTVDVTRGRIEVVRIGTDDADAIFTVTRFRERPAWPSTQWNSVPWIERNRGAFVLALPLWIPVVLTGALLGFLWLRHGPLRERWECTACGYDLRGGRGGTCPECGAVMRKTDSSSNPVGPLRS